MPGHETPATDGEGLRSPSGAVAVVERPRRLTPFRLLVQLAGIALGAGLLIWAVNRALSPDNRDRLDRLLEAPVSLVLAMVALHGVSIVVNAMVFHVTLRPLARVRASDMVATNAVASFLAFLPFKLSAVARMLIHRRRDGLPYRTILAWFAAYGVTGVCTLVPFVVAAATRPWLGPWWIALALVLALASTGVVVIVAGHVQRRDALARLALGAQDIGRRPGVMFCACALRLVDLLIQYGRFAVAASAAGAVLPFERGVLYAASFFLLGAASPAGMLGVREGGVAGVAKLIGLEKDALDEVALLALTISASEAMVLLFLAVIAAWWLRLDRVFRFDPDRGVTAAP